MLKSVFMFATGVFCVWYVPAGKAAVFGEAGFIVSLLAGRVVAIPVSLFAVIGALISAFLMRPTSSVTIWQSARVGWGEVTNPNKS
ncbi:MAG: hypothetical protein Q8N35_02465 [Methylococcaceae bacterium]|nr:hypothetical protein [Methylococcaceae bacterium]MDZ4156844.1 hypothetical protein [Methylococcales bacterium]MDP2391754.1 hypothetical protein [Methylococcaceae bacterium]MDP3018428.1 hypothetical protein [Methylococcaceae bacterium]MDP3392098.1 hypothetical protein [Methylococcaceae bacterium]